MIFAALIVCGFYKWTAEESQLNVNETTEAEGMNWQDFVDLMAYLGGLAVALWLIGWLLLALAFFITGHAVNKLFVEGISKV